MLVNLTEDSRCLLTSLVWEGQIAVTVNITHVDQKVESLELVNRTGDQNMPVKDFNGYTVKLFGVEPYPVSSQEIEYSEYTANFKVSTN